MEYLSISTINIPITWIAFFIAAVSLERIVKKLDDPYKKYLDTLLWLYIALWKGSYILFYWDSFTQSPMSLLYFDGGIKGHITAVLGLCMYLWRKRHILSTAQMWMLWLYFLAVYQIVFTLLTQQWLLAALWGILLAVLMRKNNQQIWFPQALLLLWQYAWSDGLPIAFILFLLFNMVNNTQSMQKQLLSLMFVAGMASMLFDEIDVSTNKEVKEFTAIALSTTTGEMYDIQEKESKVTIVNFFATWCPPCKAEMPHLQRFAEQLPDDVELIGINLTARDKGMGELEQFMKQYNVTYPVLMDKTDQTGTDFHILSIPTTVILDKNKREVERIIGPVSEEVLDKLVEKYDDTGN